MRRGDKLAMLVAKMTSEQYRAFVAIRKAELAAWRASGNIGYPIKGGRK